MGCCHYGTALNRAIEETSRFGHDVCDPVPSISTNRHEKVTELSLAERFEIGLERARATLRSTMQKGIRSAIMPLSRRYKTDRFYFTKRLMGKFATDTVFFKTKTLHQHIGSQIFTHKCGFKAAYHLSRINGEQVGEALADFVHEYGAPEHLTFDGASVQTGSKTRFQEVVRKSGIDYHVSQPRRPNENPAEQSIREIKKQWYSLQSKTGAHDRLADYGISYICEVSNVTTSSSKYARGRTPLEIISGETPDISEYLDFGFYDWVTFKSNAGVGSPDLGRWLGVSHRIGPMMSYWILPKSGIPISCTTVQRLTNLEKQMDSWKFRMKQFDEDLHQKFNARTAAIELDPGAIQAGKHLSLDMEDEEFLEEYRQVIDDEELPHADNVQSSDDDVFAIDPYINMLVGINQGDDTILDACMKRRAVDENGRPIGTSHPNPILDTRRYHLEYTDGTEEIMAANIIAENLLSQVDEEGNRQMLFDEIIAHQVLPDAVHKNQGTYTLPSGAVRKKRTTRGWEFCVQWKGGATEWVALKDLKDTYPVQLADYAKSFGIEDEPALAWWVPFVNRKRDRMIKKVKSKYWQRSHKYGIRIPKDIKEAKDIDESNGDTQWQDAIAKEMQQIMSALSEHEGSTDDLIGYQGITGHLIFDIKLSENFRRKARYCADGHKTDTPKAMVYSSVVSRDSVRIVLLLAALNKLEVLSADVQNAFLTAPNKEKIYLKTGQEFGANANKIYIVTKALYGLKSASASFRSYVADALDNIGYKSSPADPDVWMRPAIKSDGEACYDYVMT